MDKILERFRAIQWHYAPRDEGARSELDRRIAEAGRRCGLITSLTATPKSGHSFREWLGFCTGRAPCKASMTANRAVGARFLKGPFTIRISGGTTGRGAVG